MKGGVGGGEPNAKVYDGIPSGGKGEDGGEMEAGKGNQWYAGRAWARRVRSRECVASCVVAVVASRANGPSSTPAEDGQRREGSACGEVRHSSRLALLTALGRYGAGGGGGYMGGGGGGWCAGIVGGGGGGSSMVFQGKQISYATSDGRMPAAMDKNPPQATGTCAWDLLDNVAGEGGKGTGTSVEDGVSGAVRIVRRVTKKGSWWVKDP